MSLVNIEQFSFHFDYKGVKKSLSRLTMKKVGNKETQHSNIEDVREWASLMRQLFADTRHNVVTWHCDQIRFIVTA